jgi:RND family efflux transporter MFP subunit
MKKTLSIGFLAIVLLYGCGNKSKSNNDGLAGKKAALEKLKSERLKNELAIKQLEDEIELLDTAAANSKATLIAVEPAAIQNFQHFIDLQAHVDADNISYIAPRGMGGQVKEIFIQKGDLIKKGQPILQLDDAIIKQQITATKEQLKQLSTQLAFAKNIYNRQKNLWEQGIGTEVQLISAKNNVEALENQLSGATESTKVLQEQLKTTLVLSDVAGIADEVNVRVGEAFVGATAMGPQIKIVNGSSLKVVTNIPENYAARIKKGTPVEVIISDVNKKFPATISLLSESIDPNQRGFRAEVKIAADNALRPNQLAVLKVMDYNAPNAVVAPINVIQTDESGKYLFVMNVVNGKSVAQKRSVVIGEVYGQWAEIKTGLQSGEQIITTGYQNLYEGQSVTVK